MSPLIYQAQKKGCGYACVKMLLAHYSGNRRFANLREPLIGKDAPNLNDLLLWSRSYGLILGVYEALNKEEILQNRKYPLLAVLEEDGISHLVYVKARRGRAFVIYDPERGKRRIPNKDFIAAWTGIYLQEKSHEIKRFKERKPVVVPLLIPVAQMGFQLLSGLALAIGFFYLDREEGNFLFPVLLFAVYALLAIGQRAFTVVCLKKFDDKFIQAVDRSPLARREESYGHYTRYKAAIFSGPVSLFGGSLEIVAFLILFAVNEPWMGLALATVFLLLLLERLFVKPAFQAQEENLERLERGFLGGTWKKDAARPTGAQVTDLTYHLATYLSYRHYIVVFAELLLTLMVVLLSGHISLNFFLFSAMGLFFLGSEFEKLLSGIDKHEDLRKEEAYFLYYFVDRP